MKHAHPDSFYRGKTLVKEKRYAPLLYWLLYRSWLGPLLRMVLTRSLLNRLARWWTTRSISRFFISRFVKKFDVKMNDFVVPKGGYRCFNDFFTRHLKASARTVDEKEHTLASPVDGKAFVVRNLTETSVFYAKNIPFTLSEFLGSTDAAQSYYGGTLMLFRLASYDYHRFHFPTPCLVTGTHYTPGTYHSVQPIAYDSVNPAQDNKKITLSLSIPSHTDYLMSAIGSLCVGSVVSTFKTGRNFQTKGSEAGYFAFGGSLIILLFKPQAVRVRSDICKNSATGSETAVLMGEAIATFETPTVDDSNPHS